MLVDSHCHLDLLDLSAFDDSMPAFMDAAQAEGIDHMLCVSISLERWPWMMDIVREYPRVSASVGVHPNETEGADPSVEELVRLSADPDVVAIGETGLDYFRTAEGMEWQHDRFRRHIEAARAVDKPVIIHTRSAADDTMTILEEEGARDCGGVMHCFAEDWETAKRALDIGFHISFSGILTFKSADRLREVARKVPADRILVETDSPYLAPVPHRGQTNNPTYVTHTARTLAEVRGESLESIGRVTTDNFEALFGVEVSRTGG